MPSEARSEWGSKRERSKGVWQLRYTIGGRPRAETFRGTEKQAERRLAELQVKYEGISSGVTYSQFWDAEYADYMATELAPKTAETYEARWRNHILPHFGDKVMAETTSADVQEWLLSLTYSTAKHAKVTLSSMLSRAAALSIVPENVALRRFRLPPKDTSATRTREVYTHDELDAIAEECEGEFWEGAFLFAAFGGGQRSEVCGVRLEEIEEIDGCAVAPVRRGVHAVKGEVVVRDHAKNRFREEFIVVVPPHAQRVLEIREEMLSQGMEWLVDDGFGNPASPMNVTQSYKRWFSGNSHVYIPFMNLRPSYATWMRDEGYTMDEVARLMRHASTDMLKRVYDRPRAAELVRGLMDRNGQSGAFCPEGKKKGQRK